MRHLYLHRNESNPPKYSSAFPSWSYRGSSGKSFDRLSLTPLMKVHFKSVCSVQTQTYCVYSSNCLTNYHMRYSNEAAATVRRHPHQRCKRYCMHVTLWHETYWKSETKKMTQVWNQIELKFVTWLTVIGMIQSTGSAVITQITCRATLDTLVHGTLDASTARCSVVSYGSKMRSTTAFTHKNCVRYALR